MIRLRVPGACLYCGSHPSSNRQGVCARCWALRGVRTLFRRRRGWNPGWELHLRRLARQASKNLPLNQDQSDR